MLPTCGVESSRKINEIRVARLLCGLLIGQARVKSRKLIMASDNIEQLSGVARFVWGDINQIGVCSVFYHA